MLDGAMRRLIDPALNRAGAGLARAGLDPNLISLGGALAAVACGAFVAAGAFWPALGMLALSRVLDGLDGAVARHVGLSDYGGLLDIACDFVFYAAVPIGFAMFNERFGLPAAVLLASFYLNAASFLGFAVLAERRGLKTTSRGAKSLYFAAGLAEGTETILFFVAMLLVPGAFAALAYVFSALCLLTFIARMWNAHVMFAHARRAPES